jgi:hypothetical protein
MSSIQILVGADPEFFVKQNGVFVSAHGLVKGDKANPLKVDRGAVQVDGMALEFNIDPAADADEFYLNITTVMNALKSMVPGYEHALVPVAHFGKEYIDSQPEEAKILGCDPDFNAWTRQENVKPDMELPFRTASGHVHIGWGDGYDVNNPDHLELCQKATKQMDFFLGLPSLSYDEDKQRRDMYGKAGTYRPKVYGVEYRTLSNAWLKSEALIKWVHRSVAKGMKELMSGNALENTYGDIQNIINNSDVREAKKIMAHANIEVCHG